MENNQKKRDYLLPASILIAALLISVSLIYTTGQRSISKEGIAGNLVGNLGGTASPENNVRPVSDDDHILGNPRAPVKIIEFSDLECPFCKRFHSTVQEVIDNYGDDVAWVYRHFPLDSLHSKARKEAEATECAAELGGNDAFWAYTNRLLEITPSNNGLDLALLPQIAEDVGLDKAKFEICLESGRNAGKVTEDVEDATNSGGRGTPYSIVIGRKGQKLLIPGALPFSSPGRPDVKSIIEEALQ